MFAVIVFLIASALICYFIHKKTSEHPPHVFGGQYYDNFPALDPSKEMEEWHKSHPPKVDKKELEKKAREAEAEMERKRKAKLEWEEWDNNLEKKLEPLFEEYDKDHFYDVTNRRWVKRKKVDGYDESYIESYNWYEWDEHGREEAYRETDVGELITRKEYEEHKDYYFLHNTKYEDD